MIRLGILGSTRGSNLTPLANAIQEQKLAAKIQLVFSNKSDAGILQRARDLFLPVASLSPQGLTREAYDEMVSKILQAHEVDWIILIGYMRILSPSFIAAWENRILNVHPSLLPAFAGKMDLAVHEAVLAAGCAETGCTVHYVTAEIDAGPILLQKKCVVRPGDTKESLKERVQALEAEALIEAISSGESSL